MIYLKKMVNFGHLPNIRKTETAIKSKIKRSSNLQRVLRLNYEHYGFFNSQYFQKRIFVVVKTNYREIFHHTKITSQWLKKYKEFQLKYHLLLEFRQRKDTDTLFSILQNLL